MSDDDFASGAVPSWVTSKKKNPLSPATRAATRREETEQLLQEAQVIHAASIAKETSEIEKKKEKASKLRQKSERHLEAATIELEQSRLLEVEAKNQEWQNYQERLYGALHKYSNDAEENASFYLNVNACASFFGLAWHTLNE